MKISVASPVHGQTGNTSVALMVSHALALTQKKNVCLTHADFGNPTLFNAIGVEVVDDATRSLSHIAKMLKNNMLQPEEVPNYAIKVFPGLDLYSTNKITLDAQELLSFYDFLLNRMTVYSHIVIDVDSGIRSDVSKLALSISDIVIIPVTHNLAVIEEARKFKAQILQAASKSRKRKELKIYFLLNHYNSNISSYKKVANQLGIRPSQLMVFHYNPELIKVCNTGKVSDAFASSLIGKSAFLNIRSDMKMVCKTLLGKEFIWDLKRKGAK